jgi:hypothetical protein
MLKERALIGAEKSHKISTTGKRPQKRWKDYAL